MNRIFDSHAHYDSSQFEEDRNEVLSEYLLAHNVGWVVNCASDMASAKASLQLAETYDYIYAAVGVHPHDAENMVDADLQSLKEMAAHPKCVAIGEIGLDYHYDFSPRDVQNKRFQEQILLAKELDLPIVVHDREAHGDTMELLKKHQPKGVVHCFSGSVEMAREVLKLGMYIGLGGAVTFKNAKTPVAVAEFVPDDRLLLETDCPYMTPVPFRGKRCDSSHIVYTAETIAEIRGTTVDALLDLTAGNARKLFGIQ